MVCIQELLDVELQTYIVFNQMSNAPIKGLELLIVPFSSRCPSLAFPIVTLLKMSLPEPVLFLPFTPQAL